MNIGKLIGYLIIAALVLFCLGGILSILNLGFALLSLVMIPFTLFFKLMFSKAGLTLLVIGLVAYIFMTRSRSHRSRHSYHHHY